MWESANYLTDVYEERWRWVTVGGRGELIGLRLGGQMLESFEEALGPMAASGAQNVEPICPNVQMTRRDPSDSSPVIPLALALAHVGFKSRVASAV